MDDRKHSISPDALYARLGSDTAPIIVDMRRDADFAAATLAADAFHRSPDDVEQWRNHLPNGRQIVTYPVIRWIDYRFPIFTFLHHELRTPALNSASAE